MRFIFACDQLILRLDRLIESSEILIAIHTKKTDQSSTDSYLISDEIKIKMIVLFYEIKATQTIDFDKSQK